MGKQNRRSFLCTGAAIAAAAATKPAHASSPNETIRAAVLGVNGRGRSHISALSKIPGVEVVALCDPDEKLLHERTRDLEDNTGKKIDQASDLRDIFDRKDIDIVSIATPNHWHALATIWACQAGKDVYVEKPGSHNVYEGRKMIEAAAKYNRIVQHGVQLRSCAALQEAVQNLRDGLIGEVYMARGLVYRWRPTVGKVPDSAAPAQLDWDLWQGPATTRPFSKRYVHYNWHWHWDYGNGDVGNQGVHETDMCLWGLGVDLPTEISSTGGKFLWDDDKETPELLTSVFKFPGNKILELEVRPWATNEEAGVSVGNIFYGSEGYLVVDGYNSYRTYLGQKREPGPQGKSGDPLQRHFVNFVDAVRTRDASILNGPVQTAHTSSALAHLGNIAYRLGRKLQFHPSSERFASDPEADTFLTRPYREPFVVPESV